MPSASPAPAGGSAGAGALSAASALRLLPTACWCCGVAAWAACLGAGAAVGCCCAGSVALPPFSGAVSDLGPGRQAPAAGVGAGPGRISSPGTGSSTGPDHGSGSANGLMPSWSGSDASRLGRAPGAAGTAACAPAVDPEAIAGCALAASAAGAVEPASAAAPGAGRDAAATSALPAAGVTAGNTGAAAAGSAGPRLPLCNACSCWTVGAPAPEGARCAGAGAGSAARMVGRQQVWLAAVGNLTRNSKQPNMVCVWQA